MERLRPRNKNLPQAVLLDWDGSVRPGFTLLRWVYFLAEKSVIDRGSLLDIASKFDEYEKSAMDHDALCQVSAVLYARSMSGHHHSAITYLLDEFMFDDQLHLYRFAPTLLATLREHSFVIIVISGAPAEIVERHATAFGVHRVFGLELTINADGVYTGRVHANPGVRSSKAAHVNRLSREFDIVLAIGNSPSDLPMLISAGHGLVVGGKPERFSEAGSDKLTFTTEDNILEDVSRLLEKITSRRY